MNTRLSFAIFLGSAAVVAAASSCDGDSQTEPSSTATSTSSQSVGGAGGNGAGGTTSSGGGAEPVCGNNMTEGPEECDDGNTDDADGCEGDCTLPRCGNGIVDPGEVCFGSAPVNYAATANFAEHMLLTDCDGDADLDAVVVGTSGNLTSNARISALRNDGAGKLGTEVPTAASAPDPNGVAAGELNGTAGGDLVIAYGGTTPSLRIFTSQDTCAYTAGQVLTLTKTPNDVAVLTLDSDLIEDFAAPTEGTGSPELAYFLSEQGPPAQAVSAASSAPTAIVAGKVDGGSTIDVAYTDALSNKIVIRTNGGGSFGPAATFPPGVDTTGDGPNDLVVGDLDGDSDLDIVTANVLDASISVLFNDGTGTYTKSFGEISIEGSGPVAGLYPYRLALGDVDVDGDLDVITANLGDVMATPSPTVTLLLNDGTGNFDIADTNIFPLVEKTFPIELGEDPGNIALADMNGDGALDIVVVTTAFFNGGNGATHVTVFLANP
jgi:cysteine-rich repeat protein